MDIYEDTRTVSRADLAAWLRQLASQLETTGRIFYGAAGTIAVADQVRCELEIEQEGDDEFSVEIEFSWVTPKSAEAAGHKAGTDAKETGTDTGETESGAESGAGAEAAVTTETAESPSGE